MFFSNFLVVPNLILGYVLLMSNYSQLMKINMCLPFLNERFSFLSHFEEWLGESVTSYLYLKEAKIKK